MKKTREKTKRKPSVLRWTIITLLLVVVVLIGFFNDIYKVTNQLVDRSIIQQEVEKELSVSRSLDSNLDILEGISAGAMSTSMKNAKYVYRQCKQYIESGQFEYLNFVDKTGKIYYTDDTTGDVSTTDSF